MYNPTPTTKCEACEAPAYWNVETSDFTAADVYLCDDCIVSFRYIEASGYINHHLPIYLYSFVNECWEQIN